jgi:hypothetical protein
VGQEGQIHSLGAFYSSIWFEVWRQQSADQKLELEKVFLKHLEFLSANSHFEDAMSAIAQAEMALFGLANQWAPLLTAEFESRR